MRRADEGAGGDDRETPGGSLTLRTVVPNQFSRAKNEFFGFSIETLFFAEHGRQRS